MSLAPSFVHFLLSLLLILVQAKGRSNSTCPKSFSCGNLTDLSFPFSLSTESECGLMSMSGCDAKPFPRIQLLPGGDWYYAIAKPYNYRVHLLDPKLQTTLRQHKCEAFNKNISLPDSPSISFNIISPSIRSFYKCNSTSSNTPDIAGFKMYNDCKGFRIYYQLPAHEHIPAGSPMANSSLIRLPTDWRLEVGNSGQS